MPRFIFAVAISDGGCRATIPTATRTAEAPPNAGTPGTGDSDGKQDPFSFRIFFYTMEVRTTTNHFTLFREVWNADVPR